MKFKGILYDFTQAILDWIYPQQCLTCKQSISGLSQIVCNHCWDSIPRVENSKISSLWLQREKKDNIYFEGFYSCFHFDETVQQIIHALKYEKMTKLAGEIINKTFTQIIENEMIASCDLVIPIPLHKTRLKSRGYNQCTLLAKKLSDYLKIPVAENVLIRKKNTKSQTKLNAEERQQNISHAFEIGKKCNIKNTKILLLDDLITTGVTANECAKILKGAGAREIFVFTIARPI